MNLISLLVGVAVAGILATLATANTMPAAERVQVRQAVRDLGAIRSDLSAYLIACDQSPVMLTSGLSSLPHYPVPTTCTSGPPINVQGAPVGGMVSQASLNGMVLTATLGGRVLPGLKGSQIVLTAHVVGSAVSWVCSGPAGMIGPTC